MRGLWFVGFGRQRLLMAPPVAEEYHEPPSPVHELTVVLGGIVPPCRFLEPSLMEHPLNLIWGIFNVMSESHPFALLE